jgi:hypothetical protein
MRIPYFGMQRQLTDKVVADGTGVGANRWQSVKLRDGKAHIQRWGHGALCGRGESSCGRNYGGSDPRVDAGGKHMGVEEEKSLRLEAKEFRGANRWAHPALHRP